MDRESRIIAYRMTLPRMEEWALCDLYRFEECFAEFIHEFEIGIGEMSVLMEFLHSKTISNPIETTRKTKAKK